MSIMVFGCVFGGALFGLSLSSLPLRARLGSDSRDAVRLAMGLVATTVAIVLGLLVAAAKSVYDAQNSAMTQMAANFVLLDRVLAHYGQETTDTRATLRIFLPRVSGLFTVQDDTRPQGDQGEVILDKIQELSPKDENQRVLKAQATSIAIQIDQMRWLIFAQKMIPVPKLLLVMLTCWLTVLFASFGLFGPRDPAVVVGLCTSALAVSGAIFLILELYNPDTGLLRVSDAPLRAALAQLGH